MFIHRNVSAVVYNEATWLTFNPKPKITHPKKFLIFPEMELSISSIKKNSPYFFKRKPLLYF